MKKSNLSENTIRDILVGIGENPEREGLRDTPKRVLRSYKELYRGYDENPKDILKATFNCSRYDEIILLKNILFHSTCEHHLMVFSGSVSIGYIPGKCGKVVGISKLARLVDAFARRLQIQEEMTIQIGTSLVKYLKPRAVGIIIEGVHTCMTARGVQKPGASMVTSYMYGSFRRNPSSRLEFLYLVKS